MFKKLFPLVLFLLTASSALGQTQPPATYQPQLISYNGAPPASTGACTLDLVALDVTTGNFYSCNPSGHVWVLAGGSLLSSNNTVTGINTFTKQIVSTVATGTAPFSIASQTLVPNLNVAFLNGATFAAPGPIGSGTPGSGAFTTVSASGQITSTVSTGTAPLSIASTTLVPNLNAQLLGGLSAPASAILGLTDAQAPTNKTFDISANTLKTATNTAGHYPRNNGTQYVDATIAGADLPATTSNCTGTNFAQGLNAGGTPICAAAGGGVSEMTWSQGSVLNTVFGTCPSAILSCSMETVFAKAHTLVRITFVLTQSPAGCSPAGTVGVLDVTSSTTIGSIALSNGQATGFVDSGALSASMTAGHTFVLGTTVSSAGCTTAPNLSGLTAVIQ